jgi:signal-transduction protein with cAMP-binding, CBS, and nucleotidyltransferase domain
MPLAAARPAAHPGHRRGRHAATTHDGNQDDHAAAAAYLMKHAGASALMVLHAHTGQPMGIITGKDIAHAVADGKDLEQTWTHDLMTGSR